MTPIPRSSRSRWAPTPASRTRRIVGLGRSSGEFVALVNADVELAPDWLARVAGALDRDPGAAAVACKMVSLSDPNLIYDAGDILRRDGVCEQRGRFTRDDGRFDTPGEVFGACAGAALYRRSALESLGGFDERYFAYLEDVDLALRLRLAGWRCRYEPVVARHAGEGSAHQLPGGHHLLVARNTIVLVAIWFPPRWLPLVAYRQARLAVARRARTAPGGAPPRAGRRRPDAPGGAARATRASAIAGRVDRRRRAGDARPGGGSRGSPIRSRAHATVVISLACL